MKEKTQAPRWRWIGLALAAITLALFSPLCHYDFLDFDDQAYVTENPYVRSGLNLHSVAWAFQSSTTGNWLPVTWISHMLDVQLSGMNAGGHHLSSVLLHTANAVLLFLLLRRMTGAVWRSGLVAALFAWHPAHVESVAWIAERKDVLSAFFGMLAMWAYVWHAAKPGVGRYGLSLALFCAGLNGQIHGGDSAVRVAAAGLLAPWKMDHGLREPARHCKLRHPGIPPTAAVAVAGGKGSLSGVERGMLRAGDLGAEAKQRHCLRAGTSHLASAWPCFGFLSGLHGHADIPSSPCHILSVSAP
jgi:hypothetical protein